MTHTKFKKLVIGSAVLLLVWACRIRIEESDTKATSAAANAYQVVSIEINDDTTKVLPKKLMDCYKVAKANIQSQAKAYGITIDMKSFRLISYDPNALATYYHWAADVTNYNGRTDVAKDGRLKVLVQDPLGGKCF